MSWKTIHVPFTDMQPFQGKGLVFPTDRTDITTVGIEGKVDVDRILAKCAENVSKHMP